MLLSLAAAYFVVLAKPVRMPARKNSFWRGFSRAGNWFYFLKRGCLHSVVVSWLSRAGSGVLLPGYAGFLFHLTSQIFDF